MSSPTKPMPPVPGLSSLLGHVQVDFERLSPELREHHSEIITNAFHDRILPAVRKHYRARSRKERRGAEYRVLEMMLGEGKHDYR